jgi:deoxyribonuclease-4
LRDASIAAFADELDRAHALGLLGVVLHPGACTTGTEADALRLVAEGIRAAFARRPRRPTRVLLEHTAGQGRSLGHTFEHLASILSHLDGSPRVGVCLDTCHLLASGYDVVSPVGYARTFAACDRVVGLDRVKVFHANDSRKPRGSRVDRHEHIGDGCLGPTPFRRLLHDRRFAGLPLLIETAKSPAHQKAGPLVRDPLDDRNLDTLRRLRAS